MNEESYSNPDAINIIIERQKNKILTGHQYMLLPELREELDSLTMLIQLAARKSAD